MWKLMCKGVVVHQSQVLVRLKFRDERRMVFASLPVTRMSPEPLLHCNQN